MLKKIIEKLKDKNKNNVGVFTESTLKTSFYEELHKNGWCDIVNDKPDNLLKLYELTLKKQ